MKSTFSKINREMAEIHHKGIRDCDVARFFTRRRSWIRQIATFMWRRYPGTHDLFEFEDVVQEVKIAIWTALSAYEYHCPHCSARCAELHEWQRHKRWHVDPELAPKYSVGRYVRTMVRFTVNRRLKTCMRKKRHPGGGWSARERPGILGGNVDSLWTSFHGGTGLLSKSIFVIPPASQARVVASEVENRVLRFSPTGLEIFRLVLEGHSKGEIVESYPTLKVSVVDRHVRRAREVMAFGLEQLRW